MWWDFRYLQNVVLNDAPEIVYRSARKEEEMKDKMYNNTEPVENETETTENKTSFLGYFRNKFNKNNENNGKVNKDKKPMKPAKKILIAALTGLAVLTATNVVTSVEPVRDTIENSGIPGIAGIPGTLEKIPVIGNIGEIIGEILPVNPGKIDVSEHYYPIPELRTEEEIQETGITAQDVLDVLDNFCLIRTQLTYTKIQEVDPDAYQYLSAQFKEIKPQFTYHRPNGPDSDRVETTPNFYGAQQRLTVAFPWFSPDQDLVLYNAYHLAISYNAALDTVVESDNRNLYLTQEDWDSILNAFNVSSFSLTDDYLESQGFYNSSYCKNSTGYDGSFHLTREVIENANEEQLWTIYNIVTNNMYTININGTEPIIIDEPTY